MKIYSYENPFELNHASFWEEIKDYPHLCVSQTLVQGLVHHYKRTSFNWIGTIDSFFEQFYHAWKSSPENEIKQYLMISEQIKNIPNERLKRAMKRNQREVMNALRFLTELGLDPDHFSGIQATEEQNELIRMYKENLLAAEWNLLKKSGERDVVALVRAFKHLLVESTEEYEEREKQKGKLKKREQRDLDHVKQLIDTYFTAEDNGTLPFRGVVLHGIHQFEPLHFSFFQFLEKHNIEIVFLVNYAEEYRNVFSTWKRVYEWTGLPFVEDRGAKAKLYEKRETGNALAKVIMGEYAQLDKDTIQRFSNMTTFADFIAEKFREAQDLSESGSGVLSRMSEQFYAPNNSEINNLLKTYFPDHFGERHFLAYPIGQFVLAIYQMWDAEHQKLRIEPHALKECLSVNFFRESEMPTPIYIYDKLEIYFSSRSSFEEYVDAIHQLKTTISQLDKEPEQSDNRDLVQFAFYNVRIEELDYLMRCLESIQLLAQHLFCDEDQVAGINQSGILYGKHYRKLVDLLSELSTTRPFVLEEEKALVKKICEKFDQSGDLDIQGSVEDLRETIHFYLGRSKHSDSSRWIVRNFQQLDGGVLLGAGVYNEERKYHLCMVSDQKMKMKVNDLLPWPLTSSLFDQSRYEVMEVDWVLVSLEEYGNFLRYSLFYATYYLKNEIVVSFVEAQSGGEGQKETPYFLLELAGMNVEDFDQTQMNSMQVRIPVREERFRPVIHSEELSISELQSFHVCGYRYLLDHLFEPQNNYQNEYHYRLFFRVLALKRSWKALEGRPSFEIKSKVSEVCQELKSLFPFWQDTDFFDLEAWVVRDLTKQLKEDIVLRVDNNYLNVRRDFLYARLTEDQNNEDNLLKHVHNMFWDKELQQDTRARIRASFQSASVALSDKKVICDYCKHREVCLEGFKGGSEDE